MRARIKRVVLRGGEDGFTIIEVLVAAIVLVLGALAVFMTFTAALHNVQRGKEMQQGVSVAQREMERMRIEPYSSLAMKANPGSLGQSSDPRSRIVGEEFETDRAARAKPLEMNVASTGSIEPETPEVSSPDGTKVKVFRFVLCEPDESEACAAKRLVVDVLPLAAPNEHGYQHSYYELQSTVVNPDLVTGQPQ
jgi:type II secretory pathway pseudopilin PulG